MQQALICEKCGKVNMDEDEGTLVVDFRKKEMSFICQNKTCKADNVFFFGGWEEQSKRSPLPKIRMV